MTPRLLSAWAGLERLLGIDEQLPPFNTWMLAPELQAVVARLVLEQQPEQVLEIGSGTSTVVLGYALRKNGKGRILSLESDAGFAAESAALVSRHGLDGTARVVHAPLVEHDLEGRTFHWYDRAAWDGCSGIGLLLVDGPAGITGPEARYPALPLLADRLAERAVVVLDDSHRPEEQATLRRWLAAFPEFEHTPFLQRDGDTAAFLHRGFESSPLAGPRGGARRVELQGRSVRFLARAYRAAARIARS